MLLWHNNAVTIEMFCPACGKENVDTNKFCGACGADLPQPKQSQNISPQKWGILGQIVFVIIVLILVIGIIISLGPILLALFVPFSGVPSVHIGELSATTSIWDGTTTFNVQVYNSGNGAAKNVYVALTVYNSDKSKTLASKRLFVGNIGPGETRTVTSTIPISESKIVYSAAIEG